MSYDLHDVILHLYMHNEQNRGKQSTVEPT